jgi:hypothetical protein
VYKALPSGGEPDVLRFQADRRALFVGDAKRSASEGPATTETLRRLSGYLHDFADLLGGQQVRGGVIAIATDDEDAAQRWVNSLTVLTVRAGIEGPDGSAPAFAVERVNKRTWVTWW